MRESISIDNLGNKMPRFSQCWRCGNTIGVGIICELCGVAKYCSEKCQKTDIFRHEAECIPASLLKTCTRCRKSGTNLKACTGCYKAVYCDATCQKKHWERHKIDCLETKEMMKMTVQLIWEQYFTQSEQRASICPYYYWGNVPAFDCLNLVENEGASYGSALKILILGVGDLRNVALTCASLPDSYRNKILFTLNDRHSCVLARLVLFLYMLMKGDKGIEKAVTEIWYSVQLSKATFETLRTSLGELISFTSAQDLHSKTAGLITVEDTQFKQLRDVWNSWLGLRVEGTQWIQKQREKAIKSNMEIVTRNSAYIANVPVEHASSLTRWIEDGVFKRTPAPAFAENPTLTGVDLSSGYAPYSYGVVAELVPFSGWDYLEVKKFKSSNCLVTMYGDYIECILRNLMKKLSKQQVSFQIAICDFNNIKQHLEANTVYDRILTSNLMDYVFLPTLLELCSQMLHHANYHATIITETMRWSRDIMLQGDITFPLNAMLLPKLAKIAFEDRKQSSFSNDRGISVTEYLDNSFEFSSYLRALFDASRLKIAEDNDSTNEKPINTAMKELGNEFQLRLRDGIRNENRIVFFRPAINRRRVTIVTGVQRYLEWVTLQKK